MTTFAKDMPPGETGYALPWHCHLRDGIIVADAYATIAQDGGATRCIHVMALDDGLPIGAYIEAGANLTFAECRRLFKP